MYLNVENFVTSYLETASWVTADSDECDEFTDEAKEVAKEDCIKFISLAIMEFGDEAETLLNIQGTDITHRTAHDFFLTRNGHGAGFWDNPNSYGGQDNADRLTKIAQEMGEVNVYHIGETNQSQLIIIQLGGIDI